MDDQKENHDSRFLPSSAINQQINQEAMRMLLQHIPSPDSRVDLDLNAPDFDKLWKERKARNERVIQTASARLSKKTCNEKVAMPNLCNSPESDAAICIQKHVRAFLARKLYLLLLQRQFEKDEEERQQKQLEQVEEGELLIQNHLLRRELQDDLVVVKNADLRFSYAASVIQHAWRKHRYLHKKQEVKSCNPT